MREINHQNKPTSSSGNIVRTKLKEEDLFMAKTFNASVKNNDWYLDTGASQHMTGNMDLIDPVQPQSHSTKDLPWRQ